GAARPGPCSSSLHDALPISHLKIGSTMRPLPDRSDPFLESPFLEASGASRTSVGMCFSSVAFVGSENEPPLWGGGAAGPGWLSGPAMARVIRRPLRHLPCRSHRRRSRSWSFRSRPRPGRSAPRPAGHNPAHRSSHERIRRSRSEEHTSELQSRFDLVCRLLLEKKNKHILVSKSIVII